MNLELQDLMASRWQRIGDLTKLAKPAGYRADHLARLAGVTPQWLRRHILACDKISTKTWLAELQMRDAWRGLEAGERIQSVSSEAGFSSPSHFARAFQKYFGCSPSEVHLIVLLRESEKVSKKA